MGVEGGSGGRWEGGGGKGEGSGGKGEGSGEWVPPVHPSLSKHTIWLKSCDWFPSLTTAGQTYALQSIDHPKYTVTMLTCI